MVLKKLIESNFRAVEEVEKRVTWPGFIEVGEEIKYTWQCVEKFG
jgi:hypothetical protein